MPAVAFGCTKAMRRPPAPSAWSLVHQSVAGAPAGGQGGVQIGHPVADVMNAGAAAGEEPGDGTVRLERREQLDVGFAEGKRNDAGAVGGFRRMRLDRPSTSR